MSLLKLFNPKISAIKEPEYNLIYIPGSRTLHFHIKEETPRSDNVYDYKRVKDELMDVSVAFDVLSRFADHYGFSDDNYKIHQKLNEIGDIIIDVLKERVSPYASFTVTEKIKENDENGRI